MKIPVLPPQKGNNPFIGISPERLLHILGTERNPIQDGKYRHWDTFRHIPPPNGLTSTEWWVAVKFARRALYKRLPFVDKVGNPFVFAAPIPALEMLHRCDRDASGSIQTPTQVTDPDTRETYLIRSLVEEAITSSQLEGASTTRKVAKAMIREGREPRNRSERMIMNNYNGMQFVRRFVGQPLTPSIVLELQAILTEGTLDNAEAAGRLRRDDDEIAVMDEIGNVLHLPPKASELPHRLQTLCDFANGHQRTSADNWIHPVIRSILLHFMIGYDHPFVDGNGRTARALFYWSMASQGYWLAEFVSISRILKRARSSYARAYLYTETDENDTTYFILNQLRIFLRAIVDLHTYLARKAQEKRRTEAMLRNWAMLRNRLNERQIALMSHALKHPSAQFTIESHRRSHGVSYQTARTDLQDLARQGLLNEQKQKRAFTYSPAENLVDRLGPRSLLNE